MEPFAVTRIGHVQTRHASTAWLIDGLWVDQAVGFVGGMPKSGKTWLALELAVAVASGRPCLGRFAVGQRGPVLLYAAEDTAEAVKHRITAIANCRGIDDLERLAIGLITVNNLRLDSTEHQLRLAATVERLRPRLLVLDPLVRLHRSDENSAGDIARLLDYLRQLQRQHGVAIVLVHHVRKSGADQPGQALRGSGDLHAWSDSSLYLLRRKGRLELHAEHRSVPTPQPVRIELRSEPHPHLGLVDETEPLTDSEADPLTQRVVAALAARPITRTDLREQLGVRNQRLGQILGNLMATGRLRRHDGLLAVPRSHSIGSGPERNGPEQENRP